MTTRLQRFGRIIFGMVLTLPTVHCASAASLEVGRAAPRFELRADTGQSFSLDSRRGKGWTVLYFYPRAGTPGCTTQACAFRDSIKLIRERNAEVYGLSTDGTGDLAKFRETHHLNFPLLSDPDGKVTEAYGVKMPVLNMAKRWTFILDPDLVIRRIDEDVDPALDARTVADALNRLQGTP